MGNKCDINSIVPKVMLPTKSPYRSRASTELERNYKDEAMGLSVKEEQQRPAASNCWNICSVLKPSSVEQQLLGDCHFPILDFRSLPVTPARTLLLPPFQFSLVDA